MKNYPTTPKQIVRAIQLKIDRKFLLKNISILILAILMVALFAFISKAQNTFSTYGAKSGRSSSEITEQALSKQNAPNPFGDQTDVSFYIPQEVQSAHISVTDMNGRVLKSFELYQRGEGQLTIHGSELMAGTYYYSLVVDGKTVDTKQWVLIH
jgi:hypothetical protein